MPPQLGLVGWLPSQIDHDVALGLRAADQHVAVGGRIEAAFAGTFTNMITAIGLFWLAAKRDTLRQTWSTP